MIAFAMSTVNQPTAKLPSMVGLTEVNLPFCNFFKSFHWQILKLYRNTAVEPHAHVQSFQHYHIRVLLR
jgi:hypothetical protein